jgi:hypothetical protein
MHPIYSIHHPRRIGSSMALEDFQLKVYFCYDLRDLKLIGALKIKMEGL